MLENADYIALYFAGTIGMNILCAGFLTVARIKEHLIQNKLLLLGCFSVIIYQFFAWQYHQSSHADAALIHLKTLTFVSILCLPLYTTLFLLWAKFKLKRVYFFSLIALTLVFLVIHLSSASSLKYVGHLGLIYYEVLSSVQVSRLSGESNHMMTIFYVVYLVTLSALLMLVFKTFSRRRFLLFVLLAGTLLLQALSLLNSFLIEHSAVQSIYFEGGALTLLNCLACIFIASSLHHKTLSLRAQVDITKNLESALHGLAKGTTSNSDSRFYLNMAHELQRLSKAKWCCICALEQKGENTKVHTQAVVYKGKGIANFSFETSELAQEFVKQVFDNKKAMPFKDLDKHYKSVQLLEKINAKSGFSIPMINDEGEREGCIILLFDSNHEIESSVRQTLNIFASRAVSELQRDRVNKKLKDLAYYDYQTKLPNTSALYESIDTCYQRNEQDGTQSALIMFSLHRFTEINRNFGFEYSEMAIQTLGERLQEYSNEHILIARIGGDEFVCLLKELEHDPISLLKLHWEALSSIVKKPIYVGSLVIRLQCNGGGVVFPEQTNSKMEVIRCAEIALANAQREHGHALSIFNVSVLDEIDRKEALINMLEPAMRSSDELFMVYQAKVDQSGNILGCEALIRWRNSELGMISPDEFILLAEESALVDELGNWIFREVCKQIAAWRKLGIDMPARVAVNVSAYQISQEHFVGSVIAILEQFDVPPSALEIEITETLLLTNIEDCVCKLKELQNYGISVALDDFGTGYSSLQYLNELPLDVLKIDRSFVNNLHKKNTYELAKAIVSIGHHMNLKVVAEGVETSEQLEALKDLACDIYQGYYFAKPMRAHEIEVLAMKKKGLTNSSMPQ